MLHSKDMIPGVTCVILLLLVGYILHETVGSKLVEGFSILPAEDPGEDYGWYRDMRYKGVHTNVQGLSIAGDFCRAIYKKEDPDSLHISCILARSNEDYKSPTVADGFRLSRDEYWKSVTGSGRTDYCRILKDPVTEKWVATCAVAGNSGLGLREARDADPPPYFKHLLTAYRDCITWFRWKDDSIDYTGTVVAVSEGAPRFPTDLNPLKSRGLQLNRWPQASQDAGFPAPFMQDSVTWGEPETLLLTAPSLIKAISFWVWLDSFDNTRIIECSNNGKDLMFLGVDTLGVPIAPNPSIHPQALEVRPDHYLTQIKIQEPTKCLPDMESQTSFVFELWDQEQRIMSLRAPVARKHTWQHVVVTTADMTSWWPTWTLWVNGVQVAKKVDGRSITALSFANNIIGKNMRGCIQDLRVYQRPLSSEQIRETLAFSNTYLHPMP